MNEKANTPKGDATNDRLFLRLLRSRTAIFSLIIIVSAIIFFLAFGIHILNPSNWHWMMTSSDWRADYFGWRFFASEPWTFPPGRINDYQYPTGTSVSLTDSIPLLAIFAKLLRPAFMPEMQYFGLWFFLCYLLQAVMGLLIMRIYTRRISFQILGALFLLFLPAFPYRVIHFALCAHWLLLSGFYFCLRHLEHRNRFSLAEISVWYLLVCLSAVIHPYFIPMLLLLFISRVTQEFIHQGIRLKVLGFLLIAVVLPFPFLYAAGLFEMGGPGMHLHANFFGRSSMNLIAFANPMGWPRWVREWRLFDRFQHEGFCYLGFGTGLLLLFTLLKSAFQRVKIYRALPAYLPLFSVCAVSLIFALSNKITLSDRLIFEYEAPKWFEIFRSSGRFCWLPMYLVILIVLTSVAKMQNKYLAFILLCMSFALQVYEISPKYFSGSLFPKHHYVWHNPLRSKIWQELHLRYDVIAPLKVKNYAPFALLAAERSMKLTSGHSARISWRQVAYIMQMEKDFRDGALYPEP